MKKHLKCVGIFLVVLLIFAVAVGVVCGIAFGVLWLLGEVGALIFIAIVMLGVGVWLTNDICRG